MTRDGTTTIRPATDDDVDAVVRMALRLSPRPVTVDVAAPEVRAAVVEPGSVLLVADGGPEGAVRESGDGSGRDLHGYVLATCAPMPVYGGVAFVQELFVEKDRRRGGVGSALMEAVRAEAAARGLGRIALATRRAAPFYEALGYEATGAAWFTLDVSG